MRSLQLCLEFAHQEEGPLPLLPLPPHHHQQLPPPPPPDDDDQNEDEDDDDGAGNGPGNPNVRRTLDVLPVVQAQAQQPASALDELASAAWHEEFVTGLPVVVPPPVSSSILANDFESDDDQIVKNVSSVRRREATKKKNSTAGTKRSRETEQQEHHHHMDDWEVEMKGVRWLEERGLDTVRTTEFVECFLRDFIHDHRSPNAATKLAKTILTNNGWKYQRKAAVWQCPQKFYERYNARATEWLQSRQIVTASEFVANVFEQPSTPRLTQEAGKILRSHGFRSQKGSSKYSCRSWVRRVSFVQ
jgi:hypothetical protein